MDESYNDQPLNSSQFPHYPGLEQLICVMLADQGLAASILADPSVAVRELALPIRLSPTERHLVTQMPRTDTVHDFAARLLGLLQRPLSTLAGLPQALEGW